MLKKHTTVAMKKNGQFSKLYKKNCVLFNFFVSSNTQWHFMLRSTTFTTFLQYFHNDKS